ncbi:phage tail protein [Glaciimonas soli]|uniref:Uncharacterized protein n=1 Tax=Glaciimonas soli TaxID=2590999 RepID=A0A843YWH3_9BURK|nr:phage tail protein [Glaciimonas soli]MQR02327.1 hypothetical protein [Glaciimonas soli]
MASSRFNITIDASGITGLAQSLGQFDSAQLATVSLQAVNTVAKHTYDTVRPRMNANINLTDAYLQDRMQLRLATNPLNPKAIIAARYRHTRLANYASKQLLQPVKHPSIAKGDPSRGIPKGMKAAGISVEVTRGGRKAIPNGFTMPLNNGNGIGVFTRSRTTREVKHRYGPSVYQLFRTSVDAMVGDIEQELQDALIVQAERELQKAFR